MIMSGVSVAPSTIDSTMSVMMPMMMAPMTSKRSIMPKMRMIPPKSRLIMAQTLANWKPAPRRSYIVMRITPTQVITLAKTRSTRPTT